MTERIAPVDLNDLTAEQTAVVDALDTGPAGIQGPFLLLLHNPSLTQAAFPLGDRMRFGSVLSDRHREIATLVVAQLWQQGFEWAVHVPLTEATGVAHHVIDAIGQGVQPEGMAADDAVIHDFCRQLHETKHVDDPVYAQALALLGADGVLELCWLSGYYATLAMVMNVAGMPPSWADAQDI